MVEAISLITFVCLLLYILFGGADYGAGILDFFFKRADRKSIAEAIAAVWEANHVWLILVVVIAFNAFPLLFKTVCISLHIPLTLALIGIVTRGSAFVFRHYDPRDNRYDNPFYNRLFQWSSLLTPFFLGVVFGAMLGGRLRLTGSSSFYDAYIGSWCYPFPLVFGGFLAAFCAYLAAVLFSSENKTLGRSIYPVALRTQAIAVIAGMALLLMPDAWGHTLFSAFLDKPVALLLLGLSLIFAISLSFTLKSQSLHAARILLGAEALSVLLGWVCIDFPRVIHLANGAFLTLYNTAAPAATLKELLIALTTGVLVIVPALIYLFRVFKYKPLTKS